MIRTLLTSAAVTTAPLAAAALPNVGYQVGYNPADIRVALSEVGCRMTEFGVQAGKFYAMCVAEDLKDYAVSINPLSGSVIRVKPVK